MKKYPKMAQLRSVDGFRQRCAQLGIDIPCDSEILSASSGSPMAQPFEVAGLHVGNRWCIHPMEGWDAHRDGTPSAKTIRRWQRFGQSGAKLIWGGEAAAVVPSGRANPNQTLATSDNAEGLKTLLNALRQSHLDAFGTLEGLVVGLQLTHSGRFSKPEDHKKWQPKIAFHHPILDSRLGIDPGDDSWVLTDEEIEEIIGHFVDAARLAQQVGFDFVDVKACHGYLFHEFLSARTRPGPFGGDFEGRSRLLLTTITQIKDACPDLRIGVRLSMFDTLPYQKSDAEGKPTAWPATEPYLHGFGVDQDNPLQRNLTEPLQLLEQLKRLGVFMVNLTCGSPYYTPHIQRPAIFPPSDGYPPPEDPLVGVARQIQAAGELKAAVSDLAMVGSGYTYLQEFTPLVAQAVVRNGLIDFVGLGRMVLSYPTMPADSLQGSPPERKLICRTFSDCTSAPRAGLASGCYPLDEFYKQQPERDLLLQSKLANSSASEPTKTE